ncbi:MAG TPA: response regulator transcription factor [Gaiellaceae bacterium]|nr:response regulator transcription factor [Gaiellaceae bacterium]
MIRVLLVADVRLHRDGVSALLREDGRVRVAATASPSDRVPRGGGLDVVVLDAATENRVELARRWAVDSRPVVAIGIPEEEKDLIALAEAGVLGFVEREATVDELVASVESAARGEASCPPRVATTLLRRLTFLTAPPAPSGSPALTARERQIVDLIADGLSNKEIAQRLYIEVATVKNHVHNILEKLQVSKRGEAAAQLRLAERASRDPETALPRSVLRTRAG